MRGLSPRRKPLIRPRVPRRHLLPQGEKEEEASPRYKLSCPTAQMFSCSRAKIFRLTRRANQNYNLRHPVPPEGRIAIVTDVGCGMRWPRQCPAREVCLQGGSFRERTQRARRRRCCGRQNRVVLAPVAGVKPPEAGEAQPGFARPSIRRRRRQDEFVSGESAI